MDNFFLRILLFSFLVLLMSGCHKDFLDVKQDKRRVIPATIADYQAIMDHSVVMNNSTSHGLAQISVDEYFISHANWQSLSSSLQRNAYIWNSEIFEGEESPDWNLGYKRVLYANLVLDGLARISPVGQEVDHWNTVKGTALFHRSLAFYELAQLFCDTYRKEDASEKLGIPLRLESDVNLTYPRSTVKETYARIVEDLVEATRLLPKETPVKERPSIQAASALLARVYLQMEDYSQALSFSLRAIELGGALIDYNQIDLGAAYPFPVRGEGNPEVIFSCRLSNPIIITTGMFNASPGFIDMYDESDNRKEAFFNRSGNNLLLFKGQYSGRSAFFTGLAIDEMYLIAAECYIRTKAFQNAVDMIQKFQVRRYRTHPVFNVNTEEDLLRVVFAERKKQLFCRGLYWSDLKRLNYDARFQVTLRRELNGVLYELPPLDSRYIFPIPEQAVRMGNLQQNER